MPLPFVEVSHLPSSSSFYSAVCQPLGLRYLTADRSSSDGAPALVFGLPQPSLTPLFQVRQVVPSPDRPLKRSRFVLAAESQEAVREVYECALRAHARNSDDDTGKGNSASVSEDRARIKDLDGNTMEVVYIPPQSYPARYGGSTVRRTQSTPKEVNRIMDWNYDVASSSGPSIAPGPGAPPMLRRSATDHLPSPRENSQGITAASVAGIIGAAVVGAAAGAAITYAVSRGSERAHENSPFMPAPLPRRSTFPDPYPYAHVDRKERFVDVDQHSMHKGRFPDDQQQRFAERAGGPPPPAYAYKHVLPPPSASRARDDLDSRSHHSSRYSRPSVKRSTSEAPITRAPLLLAETEHRSSAGSRYSVAPAPPPPGSMRRSVTYDVADRRSFVSAKSRHTASTVRGGGGGGPPAPSVTLPIRSSRPPSTASTIKAYNSGGGGGGRTSVKSYTSSRSPPRERERELQREREFMEPMGPGMGMGMGMGMGARSHISARHVPLPRSAVGSFASARDVPLPASVAGWDDDAGSVAPSDSISCVGSRRSARSYR